MWQKDDISIRKSPLKILQKDIIRNFFLLVNSFLEMLSLMKMQKENINITPYLQQAGTQARQILLYAFPRLSTPNSQVKDVNAAKAVNP